MKLVRDVRYGVPTKNKQLNSELNNWRSISKGNVLINDQLNEIFSFRLSIHINGSSKWKSEKIIRKRNIIHETYYSFQNICGKLQIYSIDLQPPKASIKYVKENT